MSISHHEAMWTEASRDVEAELSERHLAMARVAVAEVFPFLAAAGSEAEYDQRQALMADRLATLLAAVTPDPRLHEAALSGLKADWATLHQTRTADLDAEIGRERGIQDHEHSWMHPIKHIHDQMNMAVQDARVEHEFAHPEERIAAATTAGEVPPQFKEHQKSKDDSDADADSDKDSDDDKPKGDGKKCWDCGGSGTVPDMGEGDNGQEKCPTCGGSGTLGKTGSRLPFGGRAVTAAKGGPVDVLALLAEASDEDVLEAESAIGDGVLAKSHDDARRGNVTLKAKCRHCDDDVYRNEEDAGWHHWRDTWHDHSASPARGSAKKAMRTVATVSCRKCTAGRAVDGAACDYCDGAGSLDATTAMIKAADGWDQGITAQSFLVAAGINNPHHYTDYSKECAKGDGVGCDGSIEGHPGASCDCPCHGQNAPEFKTDDDVREWHNPSYLDEDSWRSGDRPSRDTSHIPKHEAVDESAKGTDRYQHTTHPGKPEWVHDEWDEGEADQKTLDEGRANGKGHVSTLKEADVAAVKRRLQALVGQPVTLTFTSDWGVSKAQGTLSFNDGNAIVTSASGSVHSVPAYNVLGVEDTGYSNAEIPFWDPKEPSFADYLTHGNFPSGATASRRQAAVPDFLKDKDGDTPGGVADPAKPGDEDAPGDAASLPEATEPVTSKPGVKPDPSSIHPAPTVDDDGDADDKPVDPAEHRAQAARAARQSFTQPPANAHHAKAAKVAQIMASVMASNPGMDFPTARRVAEHTVARYPGVSRTTGA